MVKITDLTDKTVSGKALSKTTDGLGSIVSGVTNIDTTLGKIDNIFDKVLKIVEKIKPVQNQDHIVNVTPVQQEKNMQLQERKPAPAAPIDSVPNEQDLLNQFATPEGLKTIDTVLSQVEKLKGPGCTIKDLRAELKSLQNLIGESNDIKKEKKKRSTL